MASIPDKIESQLRSRRIPKRTLAQALGLAPQTLSDICRGRSAVTLPHLQALIRFFGLRAEFWLDEELLEPRPYDHLGFELERKVGELHRVGLLSAQDPAAVVRSLREGKEAGSSPDASTPSRESGAMGRISG